MPVRRGAGGSTEAGSGWTPVRMSACEWKSCLHIGHNEHLLNHGTTHGVQNTWPQGKRIA